MKKTILLFAFLGIACLGYSQEVKVNINNEDATVKDDCPYRINGICATEDIGGVDVELNHTDTRCGYRCTYYGNLVLTNYNKFPITVLWKINFNSSNPSNFKIGSIVLGVEGQKTIEQSSDENFNRWSIDGLIVRKLTQNNNE